MERKSRFHGFFHILRHIIGHTGVTLLAVGIAFSLPMLAEYILFTWWPMVAKDSRLLLINEISFAALLVLLFNMLLSARENRSSYWMNRMISLVHVREEGSRYSRKAQRRLLEKISGTRDVLILSITGHDTFVSESRNLRRVIDDSYELRVLLMNPYGPGAQRRVQSLGDTDSMLENHRRETEATIGRLSDLAAAGKKVTLKFYDDPPFWNLIITGDYVWVQYCHDGYELKSQPEYVFALDKKNPSQGLFSAFYVHFLNQWTDSLHPEYDFSSRELIYRNDKGNEVKRVPFLPRPEPAEAPPLIMLAG